MMRIRIPRSRQKGYTLTEALVVVAIVGLVSIVMVPNFAALYRSSRFKNVARNFATEARSVRQTAVTNARPMMISIGTTDEEKYAYWIYREADDGTWELVKRVPLQTDTGNKSVQFSTVDFTDTELSDDRKDIIFLRNGTVNLTDPADVVLSTTDDIPEPNFNFVITRVGTIRAN